MDEDAVRALVKAALNYQKETSGKTWQKLADDLEIDQATLWRWRDGDVGRASRILVRLIVEAQSAHAV